MFQDIKENERGKKQLKKHQCATKNEKNDEVDLCWRNTNYQKNAEISRVVIRKISQRTSFREVLEFCEDQNWFSGAATVFRTRG